MLDAEVFFMAMVIPAVEQDLWKGSNYNNTRTFTENNDRLSYHIKTFTRLDLRTTSVHFSMGFFTSVLMAVITTITLLSGSQIQTLTSLDSILECREVNLLLSRMVD